MSIAAQKRLLTAEEFYLLPNPPDGSQQELVRGEVITMPLPGGGTVFAARRQVVALESTLKLATSDS